jgi:DNA polymerase I-like protein with 3'-5' exonuclease and polymerase domains
MQAAGLVQYAKSSFDVTLTVPEAEQLKTRFFKRHQELARWHSQVRQKVSRSVSEVRTRLGRRRLISAAADGGKRFRLFANTEIQGGAADGMKQAMVDLAEKLPEGAFIVSTVHDELIVEAPLEIADQVKELTCSAMVKAMSRIYPEVPIVVEASVCSSWGEKA